MNKIIFTIIITLSFCIATAKTISLKTIGPANTKVNDFCISNDGKVVYVAFSNQIAFYNIANNKKIDSIVYSNSESISRICITQNSTAIIACTTSGSLYYTNLKSKESLTWTLPDSKISSIAVHSLLNGIAIATNSGNIFITDTLGKPLSQYKAHNDIVSEVSFSPDGLYLASSGLDGKICIYQIYNKSLNVLIDKNTAFRDVEFNNESNQIVVASDLNRVFEYKISNTKTTLINNIHLSGWVTCATYNADSKAKAFCTASGNLKITTYLGDSYDEKLKTIVSKIAFIPQNSQIELIVHIYNDGLKLMRAKDMTHSN